MVIQKSCLRFISVYDIIDNYFDGAYKDEIKVNNEKISIENFSEKSIKELVKIPEYNDGNKKYALISYHLIDVDGKWKVCASGNGKRCMLCLNKITGDGIGIPVDYRDEKFYTVDIFCRIPCMLSELKIRLCLEESYLYFNSKRYVQQMATKSNISLNEMVYAADKRLLKVFNGTLAHDEWYLLNGKYVSNFENIITVPVVVIKEK